MVDFIRRDGRVVERELIYSAADLPLSVAADMLDNLDGYSAAVRRAQLVEVLHSCARRSVARATALRSMPALQPVADAAPTARSIQLILSALLCLLVSLEVAPHAGCGTACWAAEALATLYAGVSGVLLLDASLEAGSGFIALLFTPSRWAHVVRLVPAPLVHQAALLALALGGLLVHPYLLLLSAFDLLPAIPRCRALLRPLAKAAPPVLGVCALAAMLALPAVAAARAAGSVNECTAGDAAACAVHALALLSPSRAAPAPAGTRRLSEEGEEGEGTAGGGGEDDGGALFNKVAAQLGPLAMLALGALLLQLGVAVFVDALADQRGRALAVSEYASEHCLVCGCPRAALERTGPRGFTTHVTRTHHPEAYARLLAEALLTPPAQRSDDDHWLLECADGNDASFLPAASREYWEAHPGGVHGVGAAGGVGGVATGALGWRPPGWEPGGGAALGWQLSPEPSNAQLRAAIEQIAVDGARCWAHVRKTAGSNAAAPGGAEALQPHAAAEQHANGMGGEAALRGGGVNSADWSLWVERLAALERSCMLQAEHTGHATREASRVASELQSRFATAKETATAVKELTKLVTSSNSTVERVAAEVAAMRGGRGVSA